jgi:cytochrome c2
MNSSYLNMAAGAFLGTVFVVMSVSLVSDVLFHAEAPETEGFAIEVAEADTSGAAPAAEAVPIATLMASADAGAGEGAFRRCAACHTVDDGGANRVGPNLWNIVEQPIANNAGYNYSPALVAFSDGGNELWTYDHLNGFLLSPSSHVPGTSMGFAGISNDSDRANVIAYLRSLAADPAPLPEPEAEAAAEDAPAEGEAGEVAAGAEGEDIVVEEGDAADAAAPDSDAGAEAPVNEDQTAPVEQQTETGTATQEQPAPVPPADPAPTPEVPGADDADAAPVEEGATAPAAADAPILALLGAADPANGESQFRQCRACHGVDEGGANRVGPNLWNIVDRPVATAEGFSYSTAMTEFAQGGAVTWDYAELDAFLAAPREHVPGTSMAYAGARDDGNRADLISYLRTLSSDPAPLP